MRKKEKLNNVSLQSHFILNQTREDKNLLPSFISLSLQKKKQKHLLCDSLSFPFAQFPFTFYVTEIKTLTRKLYKQKPRLPFYQKRL
jgi:hypothetical protein